MNYTRVHVWTRQKKEYQGITGISLYADAMKELDDMVGDMLDHIKKLGVEDNTIVVFSTDNGAEKFTWPDGGASPFKGEKGSTWEGGMRVPQMVKWPGTIKPGVIYNDTMSQEDWMPTLLAAAGVDDVKEKLASKEGMKANGKNFRVHLDGYNFKPYFEGKTEKGPRREIMYFAASGMLNAIRVDDWKVAFAIEDGPINEAYRKVPAWPMITNLRADPFESAQTDSGMYVRWYADNMWLMVPAQGFVQKFLGSIEGYPFQAGSSLSAGNIGYGTLEMNKAKGSLKHLLDVSVKN
jgi:arylsulfatase